MKKRNKFIFFFRMSSKNYLGKVIGMTKRLVIRLEEQYFLVELVFEKMKFFHFFFILNTTFKKIVTNTNKTFL